MMPSPDVSLVIVSRNRPQSLRRLLISLRFLHYRHFEAVVVSADNPRRDFSDIPGIERVRFVPLDEANIARARNHGIRFSAGEIVAFCDDDAVPEPTWLDHLTQPFLEPRVGAAGGYVRGRNGISFQWRAGTFDRFGSRSEIELASDEPVILSGDATTGIKTEGTNCAFRRKALVELGGFDENFRYFLDETDMNYRLGLAGWKTAIVPRAQVHHSYMANSARTSQRAPRSLGEIGASKAYFCKIHGSAEEYPAEIRRFRQNQHRRMIRAMIDGLIEPFDVEPLMKTFDAGAEEGERRKKQPNPLAGSPGRRGFVRFSTDATPLSQTAIFCRPAGWRSARQSAIKRARRGECVTVFRFSLSSGFHKMWFDPQGYWIQAGGIFGKSDRDEPVFQACTLKNRVLQEVARLSPVRPLELSADL